MTEKIFNALKTKYAALGLGNTILEAYAATLAKTGLVTDENLDSVVASQEIALQAMQSGLDKRAGDATTAADKKAKAEADKAKAELERLATELAAAKAETDKAKADADAARKKAENIPTPAPEKKEDEPKTAGNPVDVEALRTSILAQVAEQMGAQVTELKTASAKEQKALAEKIAALTAENEQFKADKAKADAEKAAADRARFITDTATALGIPEWRQKEGFVIAPDATNETITANLTTISENLRANALPANGIKGAMNSQNGVSLDTDKVNSLAASIVSRSMF